MYNYFLLTKAYQWTLFPALPKQNRGNIGTGPVRQCLNSCPHAFLCDGWMDFLHIGYHDQVPWAPDACKTEFDTEQNLSNYGHFFINFECLF